MIEIPSVLPTGPCPLAIHVLLSQRNSVFAVTYSFGIRRCTTLMRKSVANLGLWGTQICVPDVIHECASVVAISAFWR